MEYHIDGFILNPFVVRWRVCMRIRFEKHQDYGTRVGIPDSHAKISER